MDNFGTAAILRQHSVVKVLSFHEKLKDLSNDFTCSTDHRHVATDVITDVIRSSLCHIPSRSMSHACKHRALSTRNLISSCVRVKGALGMILGMAALDLIFVSNCCIFNKIYRSEHLTLKRNTWLH